MTRALLPTLAITVGRVAQKATGWYIRWWFLATARPVNLLARRSSIFSARGEGSHDYHHTRKNLPYPLPMQSVVMRHHGELAINRIQIQYGVVRIAIPIVIDTHMSRDAIEGAIPHASRDVYPVAYVASLG